MNKRVKSHNAGKRAETLAAWYLRLKGYKILNTRFKCKMGEIDLIAKKKNTLVAVEVKYRPGHKDSPEQALETISQHSQSRIMRALQYYISQNPPYNDYALRFDAIIVTGMVRMLHLDNAWQARS